MAQRFAVGGPKETKTLIEGDQRWNGLDMTRDRSILQPGLLAVSTNKRLNNGIAATRPSISFPHSFNPGFTNQIIGSGVFSNPNGFEVLLVAELNTAFVWVLQLGVVPTKISLVSGDFTNTTRVVFVQAYDHVIALRQPTSNRPPLVWDGTPGGQFAVMGGTIAAPDKLVGQYDGTHWDDLWNGEPFNQRIIYYNDNYPTRNQTYGLNFVPDRTSFIASEAESYWKYNPTLNTYQINSGESNVLTKVLGYYRGGVLVFFRRGIHIMENWIQSTPTTITGDQRMVNNVLGCVNWKSTVQVGVDVYFLSEPGKGVYRISEAVQDQIAVNPLAVSDPIQPVIDSVNWPQADNWACMQTVGVYVYLGLPTRTGTAVTGAGTGCNVMAVYNQYTRQWESIDTFGDPNFEFQQLHVMSMQPQAYGPAQAGPTYLLAVDWFRKQIYGMYWSASGNAPSDAIGPSGKLYPIQEAIETRGYTLGDPTGWKRFQRVSMGISTFDPSIQLTSIADGYNERKSLTGGVALTKSRLKNYIHGVTPSPSAMKQMDYSVTDNDPVVGTKQRTLERFQIRQNGRFASIRVENNMGSCDVLSLSVEGIPVSEGLRTLA